MTTRNSRMPNEPSLEDAGFTEMPVPEKDISTKLNLPNPGKLMCASPEDPEARPTFGAVRVPARSAVVVMEV